MINEPQRTYLSDRHFRLWICCMHRTVSNHLILLEPTCLCSFICPPINFHLTSIGFQGQQLQQRDSDFPFPGLLHLLLGILRCFQAPHRCILSSVSWTCLGDSSWLAMPETPLQGGVQDNQMPEPSHLARQEVPLGWTNLSSVLWGRMKLPCFGCLHTESGSCVVLV